MSIFLQPIVDEPGGIAGWAVNIMESMGGLGVAFLIALENVFPPLPSEIILPLAGFAASQGTKFTLVGAIIWATVGSVVGAWILYGLARVIGRDRTRALLKSLPLVKIEDVDRTEAWFERYDQPAVFFGRMVPIFRSLISLPAGVIKMKLWKFTLLTTVGAAIWNTVLVSAGYMLGENWHLVEEYVGVFSKIVLVLIVLALIWWVVTRLRRRQA